eukprot:365202-Chlamydomonas_euryale.AAC.18
MSGLPDSACTASPCQFNHGPVQPRLWARRQPTAGWPAAGHVWHALMCAGRLAAGVLVVLLTLLHSEGTAAKVIVADAVAGGLSQEARDSAFVNYKEVSSKQKGRSKR